MSTVVIALFNFHFFRNLGTIRVFADEVCPEDPLDSAGAHPWVLVEVKVPRWLLNEEALSQLGVDVRLSIRRCKT